MTFWVGTSFRSAYQSVDAMGKEWMTWWEVKLQPVSVLGVGMATSNACKSPTNTLLPKDIYPSVGGIPGPCNLIACTVSTMISIMITCKITCGKQTDPFRPTISYKLQKVKFGTLVYMIGFPKFSHICILHLYIFFHFIITGCISSYVVTDATKDDL